MKSRRFTQSNITTGAPILGKDMVKARAASRGKEKPMNNSFKDLRSMKSGGHEDSIKNINAQFDIVPILHEREATSAIESANI